MSNNKFKSFHVNLMTAVSALAIGADGLTDAIRYSHDVQNTTIPGNELPAVRKVFEAKIAELETSDSPVAKQMVENLTTGLDDGIAEQERLYRNQGNGASKDGHIAGAKATAADASTQQAN